MRIPVVVFVLLLSAAATASGEDLAVFLTAATAAARPTAPVRGDGELVTTSPDGSAHDQIAIVRRPNGDVYAELRNAGIRAVLTGDGNTALLVPGAGKRSAPFALDASLGDSEFTREDLRPFTAAAYRSPTIVDRGSEDLTVSLTPEASQYLLQVITFDTAKKVALVVKNYKEKISNLVKMRRDHGFTSVGGAWLPAEISMEDFPLRATSAMTAALAAGRRPAALFDPAALEQTIDLHLARSRAAVRRATTR
jgi:hypothetical protein